MGVGVADHGARAGCSRDGCRRDRRKVAGGQVELDAERRLDRQVLLGDVDGQVVLAGGGVGRRIVDPAVKAGLAGRILQDAGVACTMSAGDLFGLGDGGGQLDGRDEGDDLLADGQAPDGGGPVDHAQVGAALPGGVQGAVDAVADGDRVGLAGFRSGGKVGGVLVAALAHQVDGGAAGWAFQVGFLHDVARIERAHGGDLVPGLVLQEGELVADVQLAVAQDGHLGLDDGERGGGEGDEGQCQDQREGQGRGEDRLLHGSTPGVVRRSGATAGRHRQRARPV